MKRRDQSTDSGSAQALGTDHRPVQGHAPRILIAEDHPTEREYLKTVLGYAGFEILEATDGLAALNIALSHHPDLVISDILMPKLDGLEFVRRMRSNPATADTRIIIWSASFKQSEVQAMTEALGVARFLRKPVEPDTLLVTVKATLNAPPPPRVLPAVLNKLEEARQRLVGDQLYRKSLELEEELATRQQIENALRESERRLAGLIESAMDAIISVDAEQRITIFNKAAQSMFRCPAYEAIGSPVERFIPEQFRADHREYVRHFAESGTTSRPMGAMRPVWGLRADGDEFPIDASISKVYVEGHWQLTVILRDITERQRTEQALQDSERRLTLALEAGRSALWEMDVVTGAVHDLGQLGVLLGYAPGEFTTLADWAEVIHEDDRSAVSDAIDEVIQGKRDSYRIELRIRAKDGRWRWILGQGIAAERDAQGHAVRIVGTSTDIHDRKRTEERLKESEEVLWASFDQAAVGICHVSPEGYFIRANRKLCDMLGYSAEELCQKHITEVTYPPDRDIGLDDFRRSIRGEIPTFSIEKRYQHRNGNVLWVRITAASVRESQTGRTRFNAAIIEDFTERKQWEMALQESERRLALALEASSARVWEVKDDGTVHGTDELAAFLGYGPGELRTLNDWLSLLHEDDRAGCSQAIQELLRGERQDYRREWRIRTKDGRWHWFVSHAVVAEHDADGRGVRIVGTYTNIDESKQAELDLQDSQRRLFLALAAGNSVVWEMDVATGAITDGDDLLTMYGYLPGELKTLADWSALIHEADRTGIPEKINDAIQGKTDGYSFEARLRCKDGTWCWNLSEAIVTERDAQGRAVRLVGTHSNIDDRKRAEEALRFERSRLQAILDNSPILISVKDMESRMVLANRAIYESVKVPPPEQFIGHSIFETFPKEVAEALWANDLAAMKADAPIRAEEVVQHCDGTWHTYLTSKFPVHDIETNELMGICAISADITDLKTAQAEVQRLNSELEARVQERTAELERANEALLHTNMELQHFAHATAHDLQTPLRSIAGFSQLLQQEIQGGDDAKAQELASRVVDNTKRLQTLIDNLLAYTRLEAQGLPYKPVDLRDMADEAVASLAVLIRETGAEIHCKHLPILPVDRIQITQVLQNLIENGIKYNRSKPPKVSIASEFQEDEWVFSVADNGIGIDPKHHERIFEIFRRLHTYQQIPGTGIGLALCRRIVERHGGRIWVESRPGEGSTFYFTLPADSQRPGDRTASASPDK